MKRIIITSVIMCTFLHASENSVILPLYRESTKATQLIKVKLDQQDPFTQEPFKTLIKNCFENEGHGYDMCIYKTLTLSGELAYKVADSQALKDWIAEGNRTDPTTRNPIILGSIQYFTIEPADKGSANAYDAFRIPSTNFSINRKRKNETTENDLNKRPRTVSTAHLPSLPIGQMIHVSDLRRRLGLE